MISNQFYASAHIINFMPINSATCYNIKYIVENIWLYQNVNEYVDISAGIMLL